MLTFILAFCYGYAISQAAKARDGYSPAFWGAVGGLTFLLAAFGSSLIFSLYYFSRFRAPSFFSGLDAFLTALCLLLAAYTVAHGSVYILWHLFLKPRAEPWSFRRAEAIAAQHHTLAMPGRFPWFFLVVYGTSLLMGKLVMAIFSFVTQSSDIGLSAGGRFVVDFVNIWIAAGIVSWVLWKARRWYIIAAGWAGAALITSLLLRLHFAYTLDSYILPPLTLTPMLVAASFVSIALAELAVRRTGARFKVLLVSLLAPAVLATLPALFMNGFFHGNIFLGIIILFTATLPAVQKALALFVGLCARNNDEVI